MEKVAEVGAVRYQFNSPPSDGDEEDQEDQEHEARQSRALRLVQTVISLKQSNAEKSGSSYENILRKRTFL